MHRANAGRDRAGPAPAGGPALASGANVTLQLNGVTPQQFLGHQAQYNHIIAEARPAAREPLHGGSEPTTLACLPVVVLHGPSCTGLLVCVHARCC